MINAATHGQTFVLNSPLLSAPSFPPFFPLSLPLSLAPSPPAPFLAFSPSLSLLLSLPLLSLVLSLVLSFDLHLYFTVSPYLNPPPYYLSLSHTLYLPSLLPRSTTTALSFSVSQDPAMERDDRDGWPTV